MSGADVMTLIDAASSLSEDSAPVDLRGYGLAQLHLCLAHIGEAKEDVRLQAVQAAAEELGRLIATDCIAEPLIRGCLEKAALDCRLLRDIGGKAVKTAIAAGIKLGKKQPRNLAHVRREATALSRPRPAAVLLSSPPAAVVEVADFPGQAVETVDPGRHGQATEQSCFRANHCQRVAGAFGRRDRCHPRWHRARRLIGVSTRPPRVLRRAPSHCGRAAPEISPVTAGFCCLNDRPKQLNGYLQLNSCLNSSSHQAKALMAAADDAEAAQ